MKRVKELAEITLREKTLLLFLRAGHGDELDPIRIMKGMFLFAKETPSQWLPTESRYEFEPYYYGPCSFEIYSDLDHLIRSGYVKTRDILGQTWKYYSLTSEGTNLANRLAKSIHPDALNYLQRIREFISKVSFRQLLSVVYHAHPQYAVKTVFKF